MGCAVCFAYLPGLAVQNPACLREFQGVAPFPGFHQHSAIFLFQYLELPGQGRLGHMDFPGGPVHTAGFHHGNKISIKFSIHGPSPYIRNE